MDQSEIERYSAMYSLATDKERRSYIFATNRINRRHIRELAEGVDIPQSRSLYKLVNELVAYFKQPPEPEIVPEPEEEPTFECVGCGDIIPDAKGLRWDKMNRGEAVTVSVDHSGKPSALAWLTDEEIMKHWFKPWTDGNPNVKFKLLKAGRGDCHIKFERVDGPGNTLKFVWQPTQGEEMDVSEPSGNMVCDNSERSYPRPIVKLGGKHEAGHVLGIGHLQDTKDVMFWTASNRDKALSKNDIRERDERYPIAS